MYLRKKKKSNRMSGLLVRYIQFCQNWEINYRIITNKKIKVRKKKKNKIIQESII